MKMSCSMNRKHLLLEGMSFGITSSGSKAETILYGNLWFIGYTELLDVERAYVHSEQLKICLDLADSMLMIGILRRGLTSGGTGTATNADLSGMSSATLALLDTEALWHC